MLIGTSNPPHSGALMPSPRGRAWPSAGGGAQIRNSVMPAIDFVRGRFGVSASSPSL